MPPDPSYLCANQTSLELMTSLDIVKNYYDCFNQQDWNGMLALVSPDIRHEPNQGEARIGLEKFTAFLQHMAESYAETLTDMVFFTEPSGNRVAVEFVVNGVYKKAEDGLPPANNQTYVVPAAAFLAVSDGKITRITTYYNLPLWIQAVSQ
ncbi:ketosteroid isomerase-related protein [Larkinella knui]